MYRRVFGILMGMAVFPALAQRQADLEVSVAEAEVVPGFAGSEIKMKVYLTNHGPDDILLSDSVTLIPIVANNSVLQQDGQPLVISIQAPIAADLSTIVNLNISPDIQYAANVPACVVGMVHNLADPDSSNNGGCNALTALTVASEETQAPEGFNYRLAGEELQLTAGRYGGNWQLLQLSGQEVSGGQLTGGSVHFERLDKLSAGIYVLKFEDPNGLQFHKFFVR